MEIGHYNNLIEWYNIELPKVINLNPDIDIDIINNQIHEGEFINAVYVLYNPLTKLSKIGISDKHKRRKRDIETTSGMEVEVLLLLELEYGFDESRKIVESLLHKFYESKRGLGEWFNLNVRDLIAIRNLFWDIEGSDIEDNLSILKKYKTQ